MQVIWMIVTNESDDTLGMQWVNSQAVLDVLQQLVDTNSEPTYSINGQLVANPISLPDGLDLDAWAADNNIEWVAI